MGAVHRGAATVSARTITLGADAWTLLASSAPVLELPHPFSPATYAPLTADQRAEADAALRASVAVTAPDEPELAAALAPPIQSALLMLAGAQVTIDVRVGSGRDGEALHLALAPPVGVLLRREFRAAATAGETTFGPVTFGVQPAQDTASSITDLLGIPEGTATPARLTLPPEAAIAALRELASDRRAVAEALLGGDVPDELAVLARDFERVAWITLATPAGSVLLVALCAGGRWWTATISAGELELQAATAAGLRSELTLLTEDALAEVQAR